MMKYLKLIGSSAVFVDWANVYGWKKSLKREVDPSKLIKYLKSYDKIKEINFYYGEDTNSKSKSFLKKIKKYGYKLTSKPVKYVCVAVIKGKKIFKRKCDFDMEICIDVHKLIYSAKAENFDSFIFLTGDGDFAPLYKLLLEKQKHVIVVYAKGHLGKEIWEMKKGVFKTEIDKFVNVFSQKNVPGLTTKASPGVIN